MMEVKNKRKIVRSTTAQLKILVDYMAANPLFAAGEFSGPLGSQKLEKEWAALVLLLNNHGPQKTVEQWKHSSHGSPYHVHPYPSPVRLQHAFQPPPNNSPKMFYPKGLKPSQFERTYGTPQPSPILGRALCLTPKGSPVPGRVSHLNDRFNDSLSLNADTSFLANKIAAMFPTVTDTHIRILLKKYFNREAVVISALQVEKHPLVMPGPFTMSPPAARLANGAVGVNSASGMAKGMSSASTQDYYLPFTTTPNSSPSLFRPPSGSSSYYGTTMKTVDGQVTRQHSPKMKLKFLKSIFPKADEMLILEILLNNDNNVQKVSEQLVKCGFVKKEPTYNAIKKEIPPAPIPNKVDPVIKTTQEKLRMKAKYEQQYPMIAEQVISIALESVDYNEDMIEQILNSVLMEEEQPKPKAYETKDIKRVTVLEPKKGAGYGYDASPRPLSPPPPARRPKTWTQPLKPILKTNTGAEPKYSSNFKAPRRGPNPHLRQGPQDALLLEDYLPWTGPDPDLRAGTFVRPEGPVSRSTQIMHAHGPTGLAKGPQGLAKGSTYHKNNKKCAKIVI